MLFSRYSGRVSGRLQLILLLMPAALLLTGCGDEQSPEDRIREMLSAAETAAEERSLMDFQDFVAEDYKDEKGRIRSQVMRVAAGYFLRNKSIHILTQVGNIDLLDENRARVELFVGMTGQPAADVEQLFSFRADLHRFDLQLEERDGRWKVVSARWRRANKTDFR
ncbi:MAG: hypothetical protein ABW162_12975 [Candidatus Sedimenticola sp. PURPLELP]